jgi:hypothetical protein
MLGLIIFSTLRISLKAKLLQALRSTRCVPSGGLGRASSDLRSAQLATLWAALCQDAGGVSKHTPPLPRGGRCQGVF